MMNIERLSSYAQAMVLQHKIPFLLRCSGQEKDGQVLLVYQDNQYRSLEEKLERMGQERRIRLARRIIHAYYELESEYLLPGHLLSLRPEDIRVDKAGDPYFILDGGTPSKLYPLMGQLLFGVWKEPEFVPLDRKDWMAFIQEMEDKETLKRVVIRMEEEAPRVVQEPDAWKESLRRFPERMVSDDTWTIRLWVSCLLVGVFLGLFY